MMPAEKLLKFPMWVELFILLMMVDWIFSLRGCQMAVRADKHLNERKAAFLLIEILYRKGEINEATFKNVKDLEVQEFGQSTSLTKRMFS